MWVRSAPTPADRFASPASFCGVVGIKPTYSRVSRYGVVAYASSLDQVGPFARSVRDAAIIIRTIAGKDVRDSTCSARPVPDYERALTGDVKGLRIGVPREYFVEGMQPEVEKSVRSALKSYESLGASTVEISLPHTGYAIAAYYLVATAEASANLARYDGIRYGLRVNAEDNIALYETTRAQGFGAEVKRRIMLGTFALSAGYYDAYYLKAQKVRTLIRQRLRARVREVRFDRHAGRADHRIQDRREDERSAHDVPVGHLHDLGQPGRVCPGWRCRAATTRIICRSGCN